MIEAEKADPAGTREDPVVVALTALSEVATSSADDLIGLNEHIHTIRTHRLGGW
jgi:hypothetical protein